MVKINKKKSGISIHFEQEPLVRLERGSVIYHGGSIRSVYLGDGLAASMDGLVKLSELMAKYPRLAVFGRNRKALIVPYIAERAEVAAGAYASHGDFLSAVCGEEVHNSIDFGVWFYENAGEFHLCPVTEETIME